jgi:hypothetical protein
MSTDWPSTIKTPEQILALPGYSPATLLMYAASEESLELVVYARPKDPLMLVVNDRVDSMNTVAGNDLEIMEQSAMTADGSALLVKTRLKLDGGGYSHLGIYFRDLNEGWRLELSYEFGTGGNGDYATFDKVIACLQWGVPDLNAQAPKGWQPRLIDHGTLPLPERLSRTSPFRAKNPAQMSQWSVDAMEIGADEGKRQLSIAPEQESPMFRSEKDSVLPDGFAGRLTVWSVVDPEMGVLGQNVVRANVLIDEKVQIVLRGVGPKDSATRLETELATILEQLQ